MAEDRLDLLQNLATLFMSALPTARTYSIGAYLSRYTGRLASRRTGRHPRLHGKHIRLGLDIN